jgi:DNA uptake protein ComE-like DNA-binding protein
MGYVVAPGRRVIHDSKEYVGGEAFPVGDEPLLLEGVIIQTDASPEVEVNVEPEPEQGPITPPETADAAPEAEVNVEPEPEQEPAIPAKLNINTATREQLEALEYIGPAIAAKLHGKSFASLKEAKAASGLSEAKWARIEPVLTL